jgi:hypothetical protein
VLGDLQQMQRSCLYLLVDSGGVEGGVGAAVGGAGAVVVGSGAAEADGAA